MPDALSYNNALTIGVTSGIVGVILSGIVAVLVSNVTRRTTLEAIDRSNKNAREIAERNNATTIEVLERRDKQERISKLVEARRQQIGSLGVDFAQTSSDLLMMLRQFAMSLETGPLAEDPTMAEIQIKLKFLTARARFLRLKSAQLIEDFAVDAMDYNEEFKTDPIPLLEELEEKANAILDSLSHAHD